MLEHEIIKTARILQAKQGLRMDIFYGHKPGNVQKARDEYERTVQWALRMGLGGKVHCNSIDPDFFSLFSDFYKETNGFRPRGDFWTYRQCKNWWDSANDVDEGAFA